MKRLVVFCSMLVFAVASCAESSRPQNSSTQTTNARQTATPNPAEAVSAAIGTTDIKAGSAGEAVVKLKIQKPFHVNANPPSEENLIPTAIEFEAQNGVRFEKPIYPAGESKKFEFSEKPLLVYEGEVEIKLPLKAEANAPRGEQKINGKLRFQPCDEEVCYRPQTADIVLPVRIS